MDSFRVACVQMESGDDVARNLARASDLLAQAADNGAKLAALPEFFTLISADESAKLAAAENDNAGPAQDALARAAAKHKIHIVGGTIPLRVPDDSARVRAACILFGPDGKQLARYDKMHLFQFAGTRRQYDESRTIAPGRQVVAADTELGRVGLAVCYDLRFPELFRAMKQPDLVVVPSAFTRETGAAHWKLLVRARAVENLAHFVAPAQGGIHPGGRGTHGHALVANPWGDILAEAPERGDHVVFATINNAERENFRARLPCLQNRKL